MIEVGHWLLGILRITLALVLALAAVLKIRDFRSFRASLAALHLHGPMSHAAALAVISIEVSLAAVAFTPLGHRLVGIFLTLIGIAFTTIHAYGLLSGTPATCLCFGTTSAQPMSTHTAARAALFLTASLTLTILGDTKTWHITPLTLGVAALLATATRAALHTPTHKRVPAN